MTHLPEILYLVRHADAVDLADDAARPLSRHGRNQIETLTRALGPRRAVQPTEIWHSPLVRARETAQLLAQGLRSEAPLSVHAELVPDAEPQAVMTKLQQAKGAIALVAHEPLLSALASLLVAGAASPVVFAMPKAAIVALDYGVRRYRVRWHVSPDLFG